MAKMINLPTHGDERGFLTVIEDVLPFTIRRVYYLWGNESKKDRGGHAHKITSQALTTVHGSCRVTVHNVDSKQTFILNSPDVCLILDPSDWHVMQDFSENCVLLVLASHPFDASDYITEIPE